MNLKLTLTEEQYHLLNQSLVAGIVQITKEREAILENAPKDGIYPQPNEHDSYLYEKLGKDEWIIRNMQSEIEKQWIAQQYGDNQ